LARSSRSCSGIASVAGLETLRDQMLLGLEDVEQAETNRAAERFIARGSTGPGSQATDQPGATAGASYASGGGRLAKWLGD
jgi:hypothetical protein